MRGRGDNILMHAGLGGPLFLAGLGGALIMTILVAVGAKLAVVGALGLLFLFALVQWPLIGLVLVVLSGTGFQVLGSAGVSGLPISLGKLAGLLTMVAWFWKFLRDRTAFTYSPQLVALLFYLFAMVANSVMVFPAEPSPENGFMRFLQSFVVFWLTANLAGTSRQALLVGVASLSGGVTICSIIGVLEHFVPSLTIESDDMALADGAIGAIVDRESLDGTALLRITGGLGDSNWLSLALACVLPMNLFWFWWCRTYLARMVVVGMAGLQMFALVLSYTRAGFLALAVALLFLVWRRVIATQLLVWGVVGAVAVGLVWLPPGFSERFFSVKYLQEGSTPARRDLTGSALRYALERPLIGHGYGQFGIEFIRRVKTEPAQQIGDWAIDLRRAVEEGRELAHNVGAHNMVLEIAVEYGLVGVVPFMLFLVFAFYDLRPARRWGDDEQRLLALCLAAGLIAFCVSGVFTHAKYQKMLWFIAGLAAAQRRVVLTFFWKPGPVPSPRDEVPVQFVPHGRSGM